MKENIRNYETRIENIETALSEAAALKLDTRVDVSKPEQPDLLSSIEYGINLMLEDIEDGLKKEQRHKKILQQSLEEVLRRNLQLQEALEDAQREHSPFNRIRTPIGCP